MVATEKRKMALLVKKPFTRIVSEGHDDNGRISGNVGLEPVRNESVTRLRVTQADFLRELDPLGHLIYDKEYYPDIWRKDEETNRWYIEEIPRYAFSFQHIILIKHLTHLCGNDIVFELADDKDDDHSREVLNSFKRGWAKKDMEIAWYELAKSVKSTGDGAIVGFIENGSFGWKSLSYEKGDILFPHYNRRTGQLELFARQYQNIDDEGNTTTYIDVWDNTYFYCFRTSSVDRLLTMTSKEMADEEREDNETNAQIPANTLLERYDLSGFVLAEKPVRHGFEKIPVAYHRCDDGPCWSKSQEAIDNYESGFSRLAQSNHDFGLPIMYVKGEGSEELTSKDMSYASKVIVLPSDGETGFLNRQDASNAYKAELDMLETMIYRMSFAVRTPELKSGDTPGVAIKMLYSDAYEMALNDAQEYQHAIRDMVDFFIYGYGIEVNQRIDFRETDISFYITPYIHINETERANILSMAVQNGFCSKQTASEKFTLSTPQEMDRLLREKHDEKMEELLLQEQTIQMQNEHQVELQEDLSEIQTDAQVEVIEAQAKVQEEENDDDDSDTRKKATSKKGRVATGRGAGRPRTVGTDKWGNRLEGENNWSKWNTTH